MARKPLGELMNEFLGVTDEEVLEKHGNGIPYLMKPPEEGNTSNKSLLDIAEEM